MAASAPLSSFSMHVRAIESSSSNFKADIASCVSIAGNTNTFDVPRSVFSGLGKVTGSTKYRFYNSVNGGINDNFTGGSIAVVPDTTPDTFSFTPISGAAPNQWVESEGIVVQGINTRAPVSVDGGECSFNGGTWTSVAGTVALANFVRVRLTAPSGFGQTASAVLTIGGVSASFTEDGQTGVVVLTAGGIQEPHLQTQQSIISCCL